MVVVCMRLVVSALACACACLHVLFLPCACLVDFDFVFTPKNKIEYKSLILNHSELQFPKNLNEQIAIFYHMNYMNLSTDYYPIKIKSKSDKIMEMSFNRYNLTTKDLLIDKIL